MSLQEHGITPVRMLADTGVFDVPVIWAIAFMQTNDDVEILAGTKAGIAHAQRPIEAWRWTFAYAAASRSRRADWSATDGAGSSNTLDILEQLRMMALVQKHAYRDPTTMPVCRSFANCF